jgi:eukaryotic-like serine/threonine-protein kinase
VNDNKSAPLVAGRYQIEGRLGIGASSIVYLAFDRRLGQHVAVKVLAEHLADDPAYVSAFRREAIAAARLVHPNIVQVFNFGFDESLAQHFIVMECMLGGTCGKMLRDRGRVDAGQAIEVVSQAALGLHHAHRNRLVHCDVKPSNLLISDGGIVKVADFGISRELGVVRGVLGEKRYMAPEQGAGAPASPSFDVFALAATCLHLMAGQPAERMSSGALVVRELGGDVAPVLRSLARATSADPGERPQDVLSLAHELKTALEARGEFAS